VQAISRVVSASRSAHVFCVLDVMSHKQTLQGAHQQGRIEKVQCVLSDARDVREIRRRQAGATIKRDTVKRNSVRAQTASVANFVSISKHNKTDIGIARKQKSATRREITRSASNVTSNIPCGECKPQRTCILRLGCDVTQTNIARRA
jgi:hypothetical protein